MTEHGRTFNEPQTFSRQPEPNMVVGEIYPSDFHYSSVTLHGDPIYPNYYGVDLVGGCGVPVLSPIDGVVEQNGFENWIGPYDSARTGNSYIIVRGTGGHSNLIYLMYHGIYDVRPGQKLNQGDPVGVEANVGNSTGCHTHLTLWDDGQVVNYKTYSEQQTHTVAEIPYDDIFKQVANETGVDYTRLVAISYIESGFQPKASSIVGAMGIAQIMPSTWDWLCSDLGNRYDVYDNLTCSARVIQWIDKEEGDKDLSIRAAMYNAGVGAIRENNYQPLPGENQTYVRRFDRAYTMFNE